MKFLYLNWGLKRSWGIITVFRASLSIHDEFLFYCQISIYVSPNEHLRKKCSIWTKRKFCMMCYWKFPNLPPFWSVIRINLLSVWQELWPMFRNCCHLTWSFHSIVQNTAKMRRGVMWERERYWKWHKNAQDSFLLRNIPLDTCTYVGRASSFIPWTLTLSNSSRCPLRRFVRFRY